MDPTQFDPTLVDPSQVDINNLPISSGIDPSTLVDPSSLYVPPDSSYPVVFSDPGASSGGSITPSAGSSAPGGSGFGTFLGSLGASFARAFTGPSYGANTQVGRTATGTPCTLGTAGCGAVVPGASGNTTLLVLVALGALVVVIALRK